MGWSGLTNGQLLEKAESDFDVFVTGDRNLTFQQRLSTFNIAVVILYAESTQLRHTLVLMPKMFAVLTTIKPGDVVNIRP